MFQNTPRALPPPYINGKFKDSFIYKYLFYLWNSLILSFDQINAINAITDFVPFSIQLAVNHALRVYTRHNFHFVVCTRLDVWRCYYNNKTTVFLHNQDPKPVTRQNTI